MSEATKVADATLETEAATLREEVRQLKTAFNGMENAYFAERAAKEAAEQRCATLESALCEVRAIALTGRVNGPLSFCGELDRIASTALAAASPAGG